MSNFDTVLPRPCPLTLLLEHLLRWNLMCFVQDSRLCVLPSGPRNRTEALKKKGFRFSQRA